MLAVLKKELMNAPTELQSPVSLSSTKKAKFPREILRDFEACSSSSSAINSAFSLCFGDSALIACSPSRPTFGTYQRLFCGYDEIYCVFMGSLNNLSSLIKQYGLSKATNEAMLVIEAYRTLRDRGPYPAHQVLKDLEGTFGFLVFDYKSRTVFTALNADDDERLRLFWGFAADGSVVISDNLMLIKESCAKSFAPFPSGCMFHSEEGLMSFEHPRRKMKAMPRIDSEGIMCGANFKVDTQTKVSAMPRVGSEANWALRSSHA